MVVRKNVLVKVEEEDIVNGSFVVPENVTVIGTKAFLGLKNLTKIQLHDNITAIKSYAFMSCKNLEEIKLPKNLTTIEQKAFMDCTNLEKIEFNENLEFIGDNAFNHCASIEEIYLHDNIKNIEQGAFYNCYSLKDIVLPKNLEVLKSHVFAKCDSIEEIYIPESVKKIESLAFYECSKLKTFIYPKNLTEIGDGAFSKCTSIEYAFLPDSLKSIGNNCFASCSNLRHITLPDSLQKIGSKAFSHCEKLDNVNIPENVKVLKSETFNECSYLSTITLPNSLTSIEDKAFFNCTGLEEISIPDKVKSIGNNAFENCLELRFVDFPKNLTEIGVSCFENCRRLSNFELSNKLKYIQDNAFKECKAITEITIPKSVEYIGAHAFENCYSLQSANIDCNIPFLSDNTFSGCMELESVILPKNITSIGKKCFSDCELLEKVVLPDTLLSIDESAFEYCNLKTLDIPESVEEIGAYAFLKCENLTKVSLPENLTKIKNGVFQNCSSLKTINIPSNVKTIGAYAFGFNKSLKKLVLPVGLTEIFSSAFYDCPSLESINIPETVTKISDKAFEKCTNLKKLHIPNNVKSFGDFRATFSFFEKCDDGFNLLQNETDKSIPLSSIKLNLAFLSRNWDKHEMLLREQNNANICYFYNTFLKEQSDQIIENFLNNHNFTFFKQLNIPDVPENRYELFNALYNLGTFLTPIEKDGKKIDYAQKIVGLLLEKERKGIAKISDIKRIFLTMKNDGFKPEFTEFFLQNFDDLLGADVLIPGFTAWSYNEFENVQRTNTSNRGSQRQLKPTLEKFFKYFSNSDFIGITEENKHIAKAIARFFTEQKSFEKALEIDKERIDKNTPNNILGYHLEEEYPLNDNNPFEKIDRYVYDTQNLKVETLSNFIGIANNEFTFDWLEKNDPQNFILGKLCTCCAHLEGAGYGIMRASIVDENVQNLVIRNQDGVIVAKSTLYINPTERYGVLNNVEINDNIEGEYLPHIYEKFMLGVKTFAEEYNKKYPYKSLKQINVGMHLNDLEGELRENNSKSKVLLKAIDYSIYCPPDELYEGDSNIEQYIVWSADKQMKKSSKKINPEQEIEK